MTANKINIAIDVRSLMEGRHSGVEEYTTKIIQGMLRVEPHNTYHLFYNSWKKVNLPIFEGNVIVHALQFPNKIFNLLQFLSGMPRWNYLVEADCYFVPNLRLLPISQKKPLIVTAHDLSFERFPEFYSPARRLWHKLMRPKFLMHRADSIIAVSDATAYDITKLYGITRDKIHVIHSGVSQIHYALPADHHKVSEIYSLPQKFILYLGTREPRKNIASLINAFAYIASEIPHDLVIAGSHGWSTSIIEKAIVETDVADRIHHIGFVEQEHKMTLLSLADLFVYPSYYEGFGFPPLEALLAGTPVLTSNNSSLPEIVGQWATLINPYDPAELALTMKEIVLDQPPVPDYVKKEIISTYSWDKAARQTLKVLKSTV